MVSGRFTRCIREFWNGTSNRSSACSITSRCCGPGFHAACKFFGSVPARPQNVIRYATLDATTVTRELASRAAGTIGRIRHGSVCGIFLLHRNGHPNQANPATSVLHMLVYRPSWLAKGPAVRPCCITSQCCGRPRVASKVCPWYSVPWRVALAATDCHPLSRHGTDTRNLEVAYRLAVSVGRSRDGQSRTRPSAACVVAVRRQGVRR